MSNSTSIQGLTVNTVVQNISLYNISYLLKICRTFPVLLYILISYNTLQGETKDTISISVKEGWNLLSIPIDVPDRHIKALFPNSISSAFSFTHGYTQLDTVQQGVGFWLKFPDDETISIVGQGIDGSVILDSGWNLFGSIAEPIAASDVYFSASDSLLPTFYSYEPSTGYHIVDTLLAGKGYWVRANQRGTLTFSKWEFMGLSDESVSAIAIHPHNPNIIYVGSQYEFSSNHLGKLMKSTDGGATFDTLILGGSYIDIVIDPVHPETLYSVPFSILKSTNGGDTWAPIVDSIYLDWETRISSFAIDPLHTEILYAGTAGFFGGEMYKSTNGGSSWKKLYRSEATTPGLKDGIVSICIDPINSNIVYAGTEWLGLVIKSTDAGYSWKITSIGETGSGIEFISVNPYNHLMVSTAIRFDGMYLSSDQGSNWLRQDPSDTSMGTSRMIYTGQENNNIYVATAFGQYVKKYSKWIDISNGLSNEVMIAHKMSGKEVLYAGLHKIDGKGGLYRRKVK